MVGEWGLGDRCSLLAAGGVEKQQGGHAMVFPQWVQMRQQDGGKGRVAVVLELQITDALPQSFIGGNVICLWTHLDETFILCRMA